MINSNHKEKFICKTFPGKPVIAGTSTTESQSGGTVPHQGPEAMHLSFFVNTMKQFAKISTGFAPNTKLTSKH
jgi:hypothetical protein